MPSDRSPAVISVDPPTQYVGIANWTQKMVEAALSAASSGYLYQLAAFIRFAYSDPGLQGGLAFRSKGARKNRIWSPGPGGPKAVKVMEELKERFERLELPMAPRGEVGRIHEEGITATVSLGRVSWHRESSLYVPCLRYWPLSCLRYDNAGASWYVKTREGEEKVESNSLYWHLFSPYGSYLAFEKGLWWALARRLLLSHYAIGDMGRNAEIAAKVWGTLEVNDAEDREVSKRIAEDMSAKKGIFVLQHGEKFTPFTPGSGAHQIYERILNISSSSTSALVRGGNLLEKVDGGSKAAADVQAETGDEWKEDDGSLISEYEMKALVVPYVRVNYGDDASLVPSIKYDNKKHGDRKGITEAARNLIEIAERAKAMGATPEIVETILTKAYKMIASIQE